jgi:hypothetical protein
MQLWDIKHTILACWQWIHEEWCGLPTCMNCSLGVGFVTMKLLPRAVLDRSTKQVWQRLYCSAIFFPCLFKLYCRGGYVKVKMDVMKPWIDKRSLSSLGSRTRFSHQLHLWPPREIIYSSPAMLVVYIVLVELCMHIFREVSNFIESGSLKSRLSNLIEFGSMKR